MSLPTGLAGTSLALGIFNATQIASIKSQIESLTTLTRRKNIYVVLCQLW